MTLEVSLINKLVTPSYIRSVIDNAHRHHTGGASSPGTRSPSKKHKDYSFFLFFLATIDAGSMDSQSSSNQNEGGCGEFTIFISTYPGQFQVSPLHFYVGVSKKVMFSFQFSNRPVHG